MIVLPLLAAGLVAALPANSRAQTGLLDNALYTNLSGTLQAYTDYYIDVAAGRKTLIIRIAPGSGDADLYVRLNSIPRSWGYDYVSAFGLGVTDSVAITNPAAGRWYISMYGFSAYSGWSLIAGGPLISRSPTTASRTVTQGGSIPTNQAISVSNSSIVGLVSGLAVGTITFATSSGGWGIVTGWLNASLTGTTAPATLNLVPNTTDLPPGVYTATVPITSTTANNSPQDVTYTYTVNRPATQTVLTSGVPVTGLSATTAGTWKDFYIDVPAGRTRLKVEMSGGTGDPDLYVRFNAQPDLALYDCRPYVGGSAETCEFSSPAAGRWYIMIQAYSSYSGVQLVATALDELISLSPTSRTFSATQGGANPASQTVSVTNSGDGTLTGLAVGTITYSANATNWLTATLNQTTAPATLTLQPTTGALTAGTYTATVPVTSSVAGNSPQNVSVSFTVIAPTTIVLTPTSRTFTAAQGGANPASQTVAVTNGGGGSLTGLAVGTIAYTTLSSYGDPATDWLTATLNQATAPATLTLQPATGTIAPGSYRATVPITSGAASNSPQNVTVDFTINRPAPIPLTDGTPVTGISASKGYLLDYTIVVPAGRTRLLVTSSGGTGDADLGVGTVLADGSAECFSLTAASNAETCDRSSPAATTWYVTLYARLAFTGVTLTATTEGPVIALSPSSLTYTGFPGGPTPASQTVSITNSGQGTLSGLNVGTITYGGGNATGWLNLTLGGATAPTTLTVVPNTTALSAGTYTATVPVTSTVAATKNVTVTFTLSNTPLIALTPTSRTFTAVVAGGNPSSQTVSATNAGGGTLNDLAVGTITYGAGASGWLTATLNQAAAPATLTLQPATVGLAAGTYTATVPITSAVAGNSPQNVSVTFNVLGPPSIVLTPTSRSFSATQGGANPASQTVDVTNGGSSVLDQLSVGTITYGAGASGWLTATLNQTTAPAVLTLQPTTGSLFNGTYTATVPIQSANVTTTNSPQNVTVTFTVSGPQIAVSPALMTFNVLSGGTLPASQTANVTNSGGSTPALTGLTRGTITYGAGASGWLNASLNQSNAPAVLTVVPNTSALAAGTYSATVPITSSVAGNSPQNVNVTYNVSPGPAIALSATSRTFTVVQGTGNPANQTVDVTNSGGGTLDGLAVGTITYGGNATNWLSAALNQATAPATLTLSVTTGSITAGSYTATVAVTSGVASNSPQNLSVTFSVDPPPPAITLTPVSRSFSATQNGPNPASQTVAVTNSGGGTLGGLVVGTITYAGGATGWLTATLNQATAPATLTLQPATSGLAAGSYSASLEVTSAQASNSPQVVSVSFTVNPGPLIGLSPPSATFNAVQGGSNPANQTVSVTNLGPGGAAGLTGLAVGTVTYGPGATGWVTATLNQATSPATLTLQVATGSRQAGTYAATVPITSAAATNSPQSVGITFTVAPPPPTIALAPSSRSFSAFQGAPNPPPQTVTISNSGSGQLGQLSLAATTYTGQSGWLFASLASQTEVVLQPLTGSLGPGTYTAQVPILASGATNSPQSISASFVVRVAPAVTTDRAAQAVFGAVQLTTEEKEYLDETGNRNGQYDLGDFLALLDRGGGTVSAAVMRQVIQAGQAAPATSRPRAGRRP